MSELIPLSDHLFATGRRAGLLLLWLLLGSISAWAGNGPATPSLASALLPDGTVRARATGSFDARAFTMITAPDGRPVFRPAAAKGTAGVGDDKWQDGFGLPGTNGQVYAVASAGSEVYIGGSFTLVGNVVANGVAKWNGTAWTSLGTGSTNGINNFYNGTTNAGTVRCLAVRGTEVYVGGYFNQAGGTAAKYVARWNGTAWSSLGTGAANGTSSGVRALAFGPGNDLYVGGDFNQAGGVNAGYLAKWNGTAWSALGTGLSGLFGGVRGLAYDPATGLYVGGEFSTAGGQLANNVALWTNAGTWSVLGAGTNDVVNALSFAGGTLYAGGLFSAADGTPAARVAKWDGTAWDALGFGGTNGVAGQVMALAATATGVYVGGTFGTAGGQPAGGVARWDGTAWNALGTSTANGTYQEVNALALLGSDLYAGGSFSQAGGVAAGSIAKWSGTAWSALGTGFNSYVAAVLVAPNGDVYVGGRFITMGGITANRVARWDGSAWSSLGTGLNNGLAGNVTALALAANGDLYVGGDFFQAGTVSATGVARWNGTAWSRIGASPANEGVQGSGGGSQYSNSTVNALAVAANGDLYVGGTFFRAGGNLTVSNIAKWNGSAWSALGIGVNGAVRALAMVGTDLYIGGSFTQAGGASANYLAKWTGTAWTTLGAGTAQGLNGPVFALATAGPDLYVGGSFTSAAGTAASNIAKWNGSAWSALTVGTTQGLNGTVTALAVAGTELYVGGQFLRTGRTATGGTPASHIVKWDGSTWAELGTGLGNGGTGPLGDPMLGIPPGPNSVASIAVGPGRRVNVGGYFFTVGDLSKVTAYFGIYNDVAAPGITSFSPASGLVGTTVVLTGLNFTGVTVVAFNGVSAMGFVINSPTQITVMVPAGASTGAISTTGPGGTATSATSFIVVPPAPTVTGFSPGTGAIGTSIIITGTNFTRATTVTFNGTTAPGFVVNSATSITVAVPAGATTGPIGVTTAGGTAASTASFTVIPPPVITAFSPASGAVGTSITITGTGFTGTTLVTFNGTTAAGVVINSPTSITVTVPAGASTGAIAVTTAGGTGTSATRFVVLPPAPVISNFTPASGPVGTVVVITGTNFTGTSGVTFNGTLAPGHVVNSPTQLTVTVPAGATTGAIALTTAGGTATSATGFTVVPVPVIASFSPASGPVGTNVVLTGTGFGNTSSVTLNGMTATFVINSPTQITVTVPAGATTGALRLTAPGGTATSTGSFTVTIVNGTTARADATSLLLAPNPAHDRATLTLAAAAQPRPVLLLDALGRVVLLQAVPAQATEVSLDVTGLPAGLYLLRCGPATARLLLQ